MENHSLLPYFTFGGSLEECEIESNMAEHKCIEFIENNRSLKKIRINGVLLMVY